MPGRRGYLTLLRTNRDFARFWASQQISLIGDWFSFVALLGLVLSLTGSGFAVSLIHVFIMLPFLVGPLGGVLADRYNRKAIMMTSDILRGILVLGFLLVRHPSQVWMVYLILLFSEMLSAAYYPASQAAFPNLVESHELYTANALAGSSWGTMLAIGAALGGVASTLFGRDFCFVVDAVSFFVSALGTWSVKRRFAEPRVEEEVSGEFQALREGFRYAMSHRPVRVMLAAKAGLGLAAGIILLYSVFPVQVFRTGDVGIGLLYAVRGGGALVGPIFMRAIVREDLKSIWRGFLWFGLLDGFFLILFSLSPHLFLAGACVFMAHIGGGAAWVLSEIFFQKFVPDQFRGRVASLDLAVFTFTYIGSSFLSGISLTRFSPRLVGLVSASLVVLFLSVWGLLTKVNREFK